MFSLVANGFPKILTDLGRRLSPFSSFEPAVAADPFQDFRVPELFQQDPVNAWPSVQGYEAVTLSDAAATDPVLLGLSEKLIHHKLQMDPEGYGFIKTIGEKYEVSPKKIEAVQERYAETIPASRCFISYEDQFPGLRRLVIFGPVYSAAQGHGGTRDHTVIGVTHEGRLFSRMVTMPEGKHSVGSILDTIRNRPENNHSSSVSSLGFDFDVNMHARGWRSASLGAAGRIFDQAWGGSIRGVSDVPDPKFQNVFIQVTRMRLEKDMRLARHAICMALDPDILRAMRANHMTKVSDAVWLSGQKAMTSGKDHRGNDRWFGLQPSDFFDPDNATSRLQAVKAYPLLSWVLRDNLTHQIDRRKPISAALEDELGVDEKTVRHLSGLTWQKSGFSMKSLKACLKSLKEVPADFMPSRRSEYRQLDDIRSFSGIYGGVEQAFRAFAKGGSPYRFADRLRPGMDVTDAMEYVVDKLILPMRMHAIKKACEDKVMSYDNSSQIRHLRSKAAVMILASMGPKDIFEMSDRWHRNLHRHDAALVTLTSSRVWTPAMGDVTLPTGVVLRELVSADALKRQGREQGHCVGGYDRKVIQSGKDAITLIFSIENAGKVIGTAEVFGKPNPAYKDGEDKPAYLFSVVQNRSVKNSEPDPEAKASAKLLTSHLQSLSLIQIEDYVGDLNRLKSRERSYRSLPDYMTNAGFDIWEPGSLEAAWNELSVYLPRSMRRAGLEQGISRMGLTGVSLTFPDDDEQKKPFWENDSDLVKNMNKEDTEEAVPQKDYAHEWM